MLPTFVIGLREGLEAALIVSIIATFLNQQGRRDLLRWVFVGVMTAVALCVGVGIALNVLSSNLPPRQQEGLETVVGTLAVAMVSYMVVWMRRHSRELKRQLEGLAADAIDSGGSKAGRAMVLMAFLAVLREGFETVVFLLAAFNETHNTAAAGGGAVLGIVVAVALGYGIYRGGVRLNLSRFFRATGLVLVLVAAGLVVNALHSAHEAGWLNAGQGSTVNLTWLVRPGSVQSSLLTGMLGIQDHPVVIEVVGWLVYLIPVGLYVGWPPGRPVPRGALMRASLSLAGMAVIAAVVLPLVAPSRPQSTPVTQAAGLTAQLVGSTPTAAQVRTVPQSPAVATRAGTATSVVPATITVPLTGSATQAGVATQVYSIAQPGTAAVGLPTHLTYEQVAALNGGRLPLGVSEPAGGVATGASADSVAVRYTDRAVLTTWVEPRTGRILQLRWSEAVDVAVVSTQVGTVPLSTPVASGSVAFPSSTAATAAAAARHDLAALDTRHDLIAGAWSAGAVAALALLVAGAMAGVDRPQRPRPAPLVGQSSSQLVSHELG